MHEKDLSSMDFILSLWGELFLFLWSELLMRYYSVLETNVSPGRRKGVVCWVLLRAICNS